MRKTYLAVADDFGLAGAGVAFSEAVIAFVERQAAVIETPFSHFASMVMYPHSRKDPVWPIGELPWSFGSPLAWWLFVLLFC